MRVHNTNAKNPYYYDRYWYAEVDDDLLKSILYINATNNNGHYRVPTHGNKNGRGITYYDITCGFDCETTTDVLRERAYMYIWQICINGVVIKGRTYEEHIALLDRIKQIMQPKDNHRLLCFIHNMNYEFAFFKHWWNLDDVKQNFLKTECEPLKLTHDHFVEFRDSMALCGGASLAGLAKDYCNTQKCKGDLDYSIPRNCFTKLTTEIDYGDGVPREEEYCDNDVLILHEYARYVFDNIMSVYSKLPLTQTGLLTNECKYALNAAQGKNINTWINYNIKRNAPDELTYNVQSQYLYRGGYTHAHADICEDILTDLCGVDITSSYPFCMVQPIYIKQWQDVPNATVETINDIIASGKVAIFVAHFYNLKSTGLHSIESSSKCMELSNEKTIDNGRIYWCKECTVYLTSWDYLNYTYFYTWDRVDISMCQQSETRYLYKHLVQPMLSYYLKKAELKAAGEPYAIPKARVNTFYGLNVKRLNDVCTQYCNDGYSTQDAQPYEEQIKSKITCFYDGVMISAYARHRLLKLAHDVFEQFRIKSVYMDTDSHKFLHPTKPLMEYLTRLNEAIRADNHKNIEYFTEYNDHYADLGEWDIEFYPFSMYDPTSKKAYIKRFKTLGAKRYIIEVDEYNKHKHCRETTLHQTVAGLPKEEMLKQYKTIDNCFAEFSDNMLISGCKLTSKYIDEPYEITVTDLQGNTDTHTEYSCNALIPCNFNMKLDQIWKEWYLNLASYSDGREAMRG